MECLVTGATGFVGTALCEALAARGDAVRRAGRDPALELPLDLAASAAPVVPPGIDVVFHLAGLAHRSAPAALHEQVNHRGTVALARAAAAAGVPHFIFFSSVKALGAAPGPEARGEHDGTPPRDGYGRAKAAAERALEKIAAETAMAVTVLRPALVYGPGARGNLELLYRWVAAGRPAPPAAGARSLVGRDDLVALLLTVAAQPAAGYRCWNVTDGECYTARRLCEALALAQGRALAGPRLPAWAWRAVATLRDVLRGEHPGHTAAALLGRDSYRGDAVRAATGWAPQQRFEDVAPAMVDGWRAPGPPAVLRGRIER
ncbi:NAD-dependent epimerase/dehydratase family protein [Pseudohaliea sp.]|uniref:NAD-dependent epimerase/dehydratase family protein n=1 Tax=Pseudohaliea sp. TaxID=2740289 RepID=UPI0032EFA8DC